MTASQHHNASENATPFPGSFARHDWTIEEIRAIYHTPFAELLERAHKTHKENFDENEVQLSTIMNIKKGSCPEDCKFCGQSAHYKVGKEKNPVAEVEEVRKAAQKAKEIGSSRVCMVAAWRGPKDTDIDHVIEMIKAVKEEGLESCGSLGFINKEQAVRLKEAGLDYYNHNLETSKENYPGLVTTHTFQDRLDTVSAAQSAGMHACCGGILGMGETLDDRFSMLQSLAQITPHPKSVPINQLVRIETTPLENEAALDSIAFARTVATARILFPESRVRLSGGRVQMSDELQALCFYAGANSIHYGSDLLLVTPNKAASDDHNLLNRLGMKAHSEQAAA